MSEVAYATYGEWEKKNKTSLKFENKAEINILILTMQPQRQNTWCK